MFSFVTNYLEPIGCLLYFIALVLYRRRSKNTAPDILIAFYLLTTVLLTLGTIKIGGKDNNNIWMYELVALFTAAFVGIYFYRLFTSPAKKKTVFVLIAVFVVYSIIRNLLLDGDRLFDSVGYSIVSASVTLYIFLYFQQVLKNVSQGDILKDFNLWLASGYLIYYAGSFIIFVSYYYLTNKIIHTYTKEERHLLTALWGLHNLLLFISALSLLIGSLWVTSRRKSV